MRSDLVEVEQKRVIDQARQVDAAAAAGIGSHAERIFALEKRVHELEQSHKAQHGEHKGTEEPQTQKPAMPEGNINFHSVPPEDNKSHQSASSGDSKNSQPVSPEGELPESAAHPDKHATTTANLGRRR